MFTGFPSKRISPASIGWMPATHLISVDLPAPLSPTRAMTSPARTSKSTSVSAWTEPKDFEMPRSSRMGVSFTGSPVLTTEGEGAQTGALPQNDLLAELLVRPDAHL